MYEDLISKLQPNHASHYIIKKVGNVSSINTNQSNKELPHRPT